MSYLQTDRTDNMKDLLRILSNFYSATIPETSYNYFARASPLRIPISESFPEYLTISW